jgi:hypothetical protein
MFPLLIVPAPAGARGPLPPAQAYAPGISRIRTVADDEPFSRPPEAVTQIYVARNLDRTVKLTVAEYRRIKELIDTKSASAWDVTATFIAVQAPKILLGLLVWLIGSLTVRRTFSRLWDEDVTGNAYASAIVLAAQILGGSLIVYALVSA